MNIDRRHALLGLASAVGGLVGTGNLPEKAATARRLEPGEALKMREPNSRNTMAFQKDAEGKMVQVP